MHIISGLKKRCLCPANVGAAATGEAPSVSAAKKPTAKEMREHLRKTTTGAALGPPVVLAIAPQIIPVILAAATVTF